MDWNRLINLVVNRVIDNVADGFRSKPEPPKPINPEDYLPRFDNVELHRKPNQSPIDLSPESIISSPPVSGKTRLPQQISKTRVESAGIEAKSGAGTGAEFADFAEPVGLSREDTIAYQNDHITNQLLLMAVHYTEKLKIKGIPCDCLPSKHFKLLKAFIKETIPMVEDPGVYYQVLAWLEEVEPKSTYEANKSGLYDAEYPRMAYEARNFVKEIDPEKKMTSLGPQEEATIRGADILPVVSEEEKEKIRKLAHEKVEAALK